MSITIETFLDLFAENKVDLAAGRKGVSNVTDWFHFTEDLYDLKNVNENELVFSSGKCLQETRDFLTFLKILISSNASGLVVTIGHYLKEIPPDVLAYCEEKNFPLLRIDADIDISVIIKQFCRQIFESEKTAHQLFSAMKCAISFPQKIEIYTPAFQQFGFRSHEPYTVSILRLEEMHLLTHLQLEWLVKSIERILLSAGDKSFVLTMDDIFVLVFSNYTEPSIRDIMTKIISLLRDKDYTFYAGVGLNITGLENLSRSYMQAKETMRLSGQMNCKNMLVFYSELGVYRLLLGISDKEAKENYYNEVLGKLIQHDKDNRSNYLDFLKTYLACNCNINETADKLFVHRNTVVYKINKISEILDRDLSSMETRVELYLASMIRNII